MVRGIARLLLCVGVASCNGNEPSGDAGDGAGTAAATAGSSDDADGDSDGDGDGDGGAGGEVLGCPAGSECTLLLVSQTLDDRVEIFSPDEANAYRGAIDLDLKPNACEGCGLGDYDDGRLDEPFGIARAGGFVHVAVGHYPTRESGSMLSFPLSMFEASAVSSTLSVADYFSDDAFSSPVVANGLGELEPIFMTRVGSRLLLSTFNNDLLLGEDTWTGIGKLLVLDADDPAGVPGEIDLAAAGCAAAAKIIDLGDSKLAVACDGNEQVVLLDVPDLQTASLADVGNSATSMACPIPGTTMERRVRYLGSDGAGGFLVAEGPTPLTLTSGSRLWHFDGACQMQGLATLSGSGQLGEVVPFPADVPTWLVAAGGVLDPASRGVLVVQSSGGALEVCQTLPGFDAHWATDDGELEPFSLAVNAAGTRVAVGASPFQAPSDGPGYGKVLWGEIAGSDDPCTMTATVTDLTDGAAAPAVDPMDPSTFRRGPNVVELVEING